MSRLTARNDRGGHYFIGCFEKCAGAPESGACDHCELMEEVCERLGKYEDQEEAGKIPQWLTDRDVESIAYRTMESRVSYPNTIDDERWFDYVRGIRDITEELKKFLKGEEEDE